MLAGLGAACAVGERSAVSLVEQAGTAIRLAEGADIVPARAHARESIGLGVQIGRVALAYVDWRQVSGPSVAFHSKRGKMIGFDVPAAGEYAFEAALYARNGTSTTRTLRFSADAQAPRVNARLDRVVQSGDGSSLRMTHTLAGAISYAWRQTAGPTVANKGTDQALFLFTAPVVTADTVLRFEATARNDRGESATDEVFVLIEEPQLGTDGVFAYNATSSFAANLPRCVFPADASRVCSLGELGIIAQTTRTPTIEDILDHTVVSHAWMGERFAEFLADADTSGDIHRLLRAVTAVVISDEIRPSFYTPMTGAIYLDPDDLWITPEERDTISEQPDYRSAYGQDLQFAMPWRLVRGNDYATRSYTPSLRATRRFEDMAVALADLLYHELAHANDFLPPRAWDQLSSTQSYLATVNATEPVSATLKQQYPLASQEMYDLAEVRFAGRASTAVERAHTPAQVALFFEPDRAVDFYSYSNRNYYEDTAELFDFLMLRYRLGIDADVAVTNLPRNANATGADYIVAWGQRGRVGEAKIRPRVRLIAQALLPELGVERALDSLPAPRLMRPGADWISNLNLGAAERALDDHELRDRAQREVQILSRDEAIDFLHAQ
jgi:hypothetical protein